MCDAGGADCNTNHRMSRSKLMPGRKEAFGSSHGGTIVKRWDVACKTTRLVNG